jgi:hypothetical protein
VFSGASAADYFLGGEVPSQVRNVRRGVHSILFECVGASLKQVGTQSVLFGMQNRAFGPHLEPCIGLGMHTPFFLSVLA